MRSIATAALCVIGLSLSPRVEALTVGEFVTVCEQAGRPCADIPVLQAYVGGALDFVAVLHEQTDYVRPIYCRSPDELFDLPAIIAFIEDNRAGNANSNAMTLVVRFLEEFGQCPP